LYGGGVKPRLIALFSEPVGDAFVFFLVKHDVQSVWYEAGQWLGSPGAVGSGLALAPSLAGGLRREE
jgi:hypothetical protein